MLTIENIHKINGYSLEVKGKGWYFKGWDNTTSEVTHFSIREVAPPHLVRKNITLHKTATIVFNPLENKDCCFYRIEVEGQMYHYTKESLSTPDKFRDKIEKILNTI